MIKYCLLFVLLASSQLLQADPTLKFADAFQIKAINGEKVTYSKINPVKQFKLRNGINLIALQYIETFTYQQGKKLLARSDILLLKVYLNKNSHYQQRYLKPANYTAAKKYAQQPVFEIVSQNQANKSSQPVQFELTRITDNDVINKTKIGERRSLQL